MCSVSLGTSYLHTWEVCKRTLYFPLSGMMSLSFLNVPALSTLSDSNNHPNESFLTSSSNLDFWLVIMLRELNLLTFCTYIHLKWFTRRGLRILGKVITYLCFSITCKGALTCLTRLISPVMFKRRGFYINFWDEKKRSKKGRFEEVRLLCEGLLLTGELGFDFRISDSSSGAHGLKDATSPWRRRL